MRARRWKRNWLLTFVVYAVCAIAFMPLLYGILITLFPSHRIEGHSPGMPLGQMILAVGGAPFFALVPAFFFGRRRQLIT